MACTRSPSKPGRPSRARLDEVIAAGRARTLEPGEHLETEVRFIAFEGISSVAEVGSDGIVRGED